MPSSRLLALPAEILNKIVEEVLTSPTPLTLRDFAQTLSDKAPQDTIAAPGRQSLWSSDQHEHRIDWIAMNGTCRYLRSFGRELFWSCKTIVMRPQDLQGWMYPDCHPISHALRHVRTVIAPVGHEIGDEALDQVMDFSWFQSLHHLTIVYGAMAWPSRPEWYAPVVDYAQLTEVVRIPPGHDDLHTLNWHQPRLTVCTAYGGTDAKQHPGIRCHFDEAWQSMIRGWKEIADD